MGKAVAMTTEADGHAHLVVTEISGWEIRRAGTTDYVDNHTHPWMMDDSGNILIGAARGHTHGIANISKLTNGIENISKPNILPASEALAAGGKSGDASGMAADLIGGRDGGTTMTDQEKAAQDQAAAKFQEMEKRAKAAEAVLAMPDGHRAFWKGLNAKDADAFMALKPEERDAAIVKASEENKVVFTAADGAVYRKNDDPRLVAMAKAMDEERVARKAAEEAARKADLEKRAGELAHVPGDLAARVLLLKGIDSLPVAEREKALAALKAHDERLGVAFQSVGTKSVPAEGSPEQEIEKKARALAASEKITYEKAYVRILESPEGVELTKRMETPAL